MYLLCVAMHPNLDSVLCMQPFFSTTVLLYLTFVCSLFFYCLYCCVQKYATNIMLQHVMWQEMQSFNHRTDRRPRSIDASHDVESQPPAGKRIRGCNKPHKPRSGQIAIIPEGDKYVHADFFS